MTNFIFLIENAELPSVALSLKFQYFVLDTVLQKKEKKKFGIPLLIPIQIIEGK